MNLQIHSTEDAWLKLCSIADQVMGRRRYPLEVEDCERYTGYILALQAGLRRFLDLASTSAGAHLRDQIDSVEVAKFNLRAPVLKRHLWLLSSKK